MRQYLACLLCLTAVLAVCCGCGHERRTDGRMTVVVSIAPLASLAREIGGQGVDIELFVRPGQSPHMFEPTGEQMKALSRANMLVLNGLALEYWADKAINASGNSKLLVVDSSKGIRTAKDEDTGAGHFHGGHPAGNPHVWLDPLLAVKQVANIRDGFCKADPANKKLYNANAKSVTLKLMQLDRDIRSEVAGFTTREFITFHPAWIYFAQRYGLKQATVIEEFPGKEPSAAYVRDVIEIARRAKVRAIFAEPQFPSNAAKVIADECGARVLMLDPMGKPPRYDYFETMRKAVSTMKEAMR
jgi:zinc transport system substrate-binding protein